MTATAQAEPPRRVLSLNLCTDQLLLALADPSAIAAVTRTARDCRFSARCAEAAGVPAVRGTAEEVIASRPDLVIAGQSGGGAAVAAARKLGIPTLALPSATTLTAIGEQIGTVAEALGRPDRGTALRAALDRRLGALPAPAAARPLAAIYQPNGFTAGAGSLADAVLARAGFANYATARDIDPAASLSLERLVVDRPALLVTDAEPGAPSLAEALAWHPALREAFAGRRVEVPPREWICGSPATLDAVERLVRARLALPP